MNRTVEALIPAFAALGITAGIVGLILLIFITNNQEQLLQEMVRSTAEGEFLGVAFTAGGPFGMWIIATFLITVSKKSVLSRKNRQTVTVNVLFPSINVPKPVWHEADLDETRSCKI